MRINELLEDTIRTRAFEIYLERGSQPGHEWDDWLQAEFELTHLPLHVLRLKPIEARRKGGAWRRQRGRGSMSFSRQ